MIKGQPPELKVKLQTAVPAGATWGRLKLASMDRFSHYNNCSRDHFYYNSSTWTCGCGSIIASQRLVGLISLSHYTRLLKLCVLLVFWRIFNSLSDDYRVSTKYELQFWWIKFQFLLIQIISIHLLQWGLSLAYNIKLLELTVVIWL